MRILTIVDIILLCFKCAVIAFVYSEVLIQEGHVFHSLYKWMENTLTKVVTITLPDNTPEEVKALPDYKYRPVQKIISKKSPLLKPLGECPYCTAGQLTLWVYVTRQLVFPHLSAGITTALHIIWQVVFAICFSILMVLFLNKLYEKWGTRQ